MARVTRTPPPTPPSRGGGRSPSSPRYAHRHRRDPVDDVGVAALRLAHKLDRREALQDLFPPDGQLQFGQPVADTAVDAEPERQMLPRPRPVDDEVVRPFDRVRIAVAR